MNDFSHPVILGGFIFIVRLAVQDLVYTKYYVRHIAALLQMSCHHILVFYIRRKSIELKVLFVCFSLLYIANIFLLKEMFFFWEKRIYIYRPFPFIQWPNLIP